MFSLSLPPPPSPSSLASPSYAVENHEQMLPEDPQPPDPARLVSRRDCTVRGAWVFGLSFFTVLLLQFLMYTAMHGMPALSGSDSSLQAFFATLYIATPPILLIGAYIGFDLYRLAAGSRQPNETKWYVWALAFCCMGYFLLCLWLQYRRRDQMILQRKPPSLIGPLIYGVILFGITLVGLESKSREGFLQFLQTTPFTLCLADCLIVNRVASWHQQGRLAPPDTHKFQFSLATLFFGTLLFGAYATGLVMILR